MSDPSPTSDLPAQAPRRVISLRVVMEYVLVVGFVFGVLWVFGNAVWKAREAYSSTQCSGNLTQISLALFMYHEIHGSFPPAVVNGPDGTPWHSWRILILPLMDWSLDVQYDFNEPWDGPNNIQFLNWMPPAYSCPSVRLRESTNKGLTNYLAITGSGTVFPPDMTISRGQITDGPSQTVMLAEISNAQIPWTAPIDLDVRKLSFRLDAPSRPGISSAHPFGIWLGFADGSRSSVPRSLSPSDLRALTTIAGGEKVDIKTEGGFRPLIEGF